MTGEPTAISRMTFDHYLDTLPEELAPDIISGQAVRYLPNTFEELLEVIAETSNPNCPVQEDVDAMIAMIGMSHDPDDLVRQLPYDFGPDGKLFINFVLPAVTDD